MRNHVLFAMLALVAGCKKKIAGPAPSVEGLAPAGACTEQRVTSIAIAGHGLSPLATKTLTGTPRLQLPRVTLTQALAIDGVPGTGLALDLVDPLDAASTLVRWTSETSMAFDITPARFVPGLYGIAVQNGDSQRTVFDKALLLSPPPTVAQIDPEIVAATKGAAVTITGDFFIQADELKPTALFRAPGVAPVSLAPSALGDCRALPGTAGYRACKSMTVAIPAGLFASGNYAVEVQNPAPVGCDSHGGAPGASGQIPLTVVPDPVLAPESKPSPIVPDLVETAQAANALAVSGHDFVVYDGKTPLLDLGSLALATTGTSCVPVPLETIFALRRHDLLRCTGLAATLVQGALTPAKYAVAVQNPAPADALSGQMVSFAVVPPPTLAAIVPDLVCTAEGGVGASVSGTDFLTVDAVAPTMQISGVDLPTTAADCTPIDGAVNEFAERCTTLAMMLPQALATGVLPFDIANPAPAAAVSGTIALVNVGAPNITAVEPTPICNAQGNIAITVNGTGFLVNDGALPTLEVSQGGSSHAIADVTPGGCTSIAKSGGGSAQLCTSLAVTVLKNTLPDSPTPYDVTVHNPKTGDCSGAAKGSLIVVPPPTVASVVPAKICSGGGTLTIAGSAFLDGASATLEGVGATSVTVNGAGDTAVATFPGGLATTGSSSADLALTNPTTCESTLLSAVRVVPGPALFFANPSVVYNGVDIQVTFYGTGFTPPLMSVAIRPAGSSAAPTTLQNLNYDSDHPNRVQATVKKGLAPGTYDVLLNDQTSCPALLTGGLIVVGNTALALGGVTPGFGAQGSPTAVVITADAVVGGGVQPIPQVYLTGVGGTSATPLTSTAVQGGGTLTAIVPATLASGTYDLIVVNPRNNANPGATGVGVLLSAFKVVPAATPPPVVMSVSPSAVPNQSGQTITLAGSNFRSPDVKLSCTSGGTSAPIVVPATVTSSSATSITANFDASSFQYTGCVVRATDTDNGTFDEFSALVVTNPAQKLGSFTTSAQTLTTARRALSAVSGRVTRVARYLYALGGDDGTATGVLHSVESTPVDLFGTPGAWFTQARGLGTARAFAGAVTVGRFIYVVGGTSDGATALDTVERAWLLDPSVRTDFDDLDLRVVTSNGLPGGVYYYRVSAVMDGSDSFNPGGESLPSDSFGLSLPALANGNLVQVTLSWPTLVHAASYRIFRTAKAGDAPGSEQLIGTTSSTQFIDIGFSTQAGTPLPIGSTGAWTTLPVTLSTGRQGLGVTTAVDPGNASKVYLYALAGKDATGTALDSYEVAPMTLNGDGTQTVGAFSTGLLALQNRRWQVSALSVNKTNAPNVTLATDAYVYVGSGVASDGASVVPDINAAKVTVGTGALAGVANAVAWDAVGKSSPGRAGYGAAVANNFLYFFGGAGASPSSTANQAQICDGTCSGAGGKALAPYLANSNNSTSMNAARSLMGSAIESAFIYMIGGASPSSTTPTNTIEYTIW